MNTKIYVTKFLLLYIIQLHRLSFYFRTMAIEMINSGVRVNAVAPGTIFSQTARDNYAYDVFDMAKPHIPAKRLGTPDEVASAVCFLMSPAAAFITGTTLTVDGGQTLVIMSCPLGWALFRKNNDIQILSFWAHL